MEITATIQRQLIRDAQRNGICAPMFEEMKDERDTRRLFDIYHRGLDFCLMHEYPDNKLLLRYQAEAQASGIYVDCDGMRTRNQRRTVCLGDTAGLITFDNFHAGAVYIKHRSIITLTARDNAFVMVDLFDKASLVVEAWDDAKVCVNLYKADDQEGPMISQRAEGNARIKVINKHKTSYK